MVRETRKTPRDAPSVHPGRGGGCGAPSAHSRVEQIISQRPGNSVHLQICWGQAAAFGGRSPCSVNTGAGSFQRDHSLRRERTPGAKPPSWGSRVSQGNSPPEACKLAV